MPETAVQLKSYNVPFDSMEPAIASGTDVLGDPTYYSHNRPNRWEVVVFTVPKSEGYFVKRIIGLPGETIHLSYKGLNVNGAMVPIPSVLKDRFSSFKKHEAQSYGHEPFKVPADSVFVMGDNAHVYVADSREIGAVPIGSLQARVLASVFIVPIA